MQRDINIALVNELAVLFDKLGIDYHDVFAAAGTKWNFHKYQPGLVGGHCIGVDPYYLTHKAIEVGHHPELILAGRRMNDRMHEHFASKVLRGLHAEGVPIRDAKIVVLGLTFKENCPDYRNSRTLHLIGELKANGANVIGIDPWLDEKKIALFGCIPSSIDSLKSLKPDAVVIAVPHHQFSSIPRDIAPVVVDIKGRNSTENTSLRVEVHNEIEH